MRPPLLIAAFVVVLCLCNLARAAGDGAGDVLQVETRPGVRVQLFTAWRPDAVATVVLYSGGRGGYGSLGEDGWPTGRNFLIRTGRMWAAHPFNVVMVGRPSDGIDLADGAVRIGDEHAGDNVAIFRAIKLRSPLPVWAVGTSMGTISAAAAAIRDREGLLAGIVLTSSVTGYRVQGAVPRQKLPAIRVPTLVVHHARDACKLCAPHEAKNIAEELTGAPVSKTVLVTAGSGESGDPCEPMHFHGYIGAEREVVDMIAAWIVQPTR